MNVQPARDEHEHDERTERDREAPAGLTNVSTRELDGENLAVEPGAFDAVVSRVGLIYFPDRRAALAGMHAALRPGGRLSAVVYSTADRNAFFAIPVGIMVLALTGYVGFESAASLGQEADNPRRAVPRAIRINVLTCGTYFIIGSYVYILGFDKMGTDITKSAAPLNDLAVGADVSFLRYVIDLGIAIGFIAVTVAALTAVSRMLFNMSREGLLPRQLGRVSSRNRVPDVALKLVGVGVTAVVVISQIAGLTPLSA